MLNRYDQFKLNAYENVKARHLSLGNSQRLGLAKPLWARTPR